MTLHADARAVLAGWEPPTPRDAQLRDRFVALLDAEPDAMTRACLPDHLTAGTIVLTPEADAVLLNHHRKADGWFAFGGHCEPSDTTLAGVALREAHEESGLADLDFDPVPLDLDEHEVHFCSPGTVVHHLDVRFLATAPRDARHAVSEESLDVRWWPVDALPEIYPDMRRLIGDAVARLRPSD
ncbi:NUDIX hydrolase [Nocardioides baculatus]|uniref:NUDIX domain-containing protein n=1 Tax=Nocardioides baculatus TaxID=2801337 RepID=A0ABS1LEG9_9ACTN|nr:NUDIX domain-containing protein [Nocardioides baculatus]MBL0749982.1 NUDIX domain-containing protein [Nocardioides baculatus]